VARAEWRRVSRELLELGILTSIDRSVLIAYCESWSLYVAAHAKVAELGIVLISEKTGAPYANPYLNVKTAALKATVAYAAELGMTPSARSRVQVQPPKTQNAKDKTRFLKIVG
jgi:P27 family predicted phage terminase small subunit